MNFWQKPRFNLNIFHWKNPLTFADVVITVKNINVKPLTLTKIHEFQVCKQKMVTLHLQQSYEIHSNLLENQKWKTKYRIY